jgi:hypothetical protein
MFFHPQALLRTQDAEASHGYVLGVKCSSPHELKAPFEAPLPVVKIILGTGKKKIPLTTFNQDLVLEVIIDKFQSNFSRTTLLFRL